MWLGWIFYSLYSGETCGKIRKRKEIRDLSNKEIEEFVNGFKALNKKIIKDKTLLDDLALFHKKYAFNIHFTPVFLPWHREFIRELEKELEDINPNITLPYWDWTKDSQNPEKSPIFEIVGGNGNKTKNMCVSDGPFKNFTVNYPTKHCLKRNFDKGDNITAFTSPEAILKLLYKESDYETFYKKLEVYHGSVHVNIGNKLGDLYPMTSPTTAEDL